MNWNNTTQIPDEKSPVIFIIGDTVHAGQYRDGEFHSSVNSNAALRGWGSFIRDMVNRWQYLSALANGN